MSWSAPTELPPVPITGPAREVRSTTAVVTGTVDPRGLGLPPIWDQQCAGASDAWSRAWQEWIIRAAG
ncbi:hypothetical protein [Kribbella sp. NPDC023855]|uniref:hypothetical protein n=1 Tax=Kribbella sp. NPDC023855 TaxID=3154698 RepID=UPI00340B297C